SPQKRPRPVSEPSPPSEQESPGALSSDIAIPTQRLEGVEKVPALPPLPTYRTFLPLTSIQCPQNPIPAAATASTAVSNSNVHCTESRGSHHPPVVSGSSRIYPWKVFPICDDSDPHTRSAQMKALTKLENDIGSDTLKSASHTFTWVQNEWLPDFPGFYLPGVQASPTLQDIWNEQIDGIDGRFSITMLKKHWATRWRQGNGGIKTEGTRRMKVVKLIETLSQQIMRRPLGALELSTHYMVHLSLAFY
ncbi:hypothetical protein CVT24_012322, partial [Panaeolus cyanescens]